MCVEFGACDLCSYALGDDGIYFCSMGLDLLNDDDFERNQQWAFSGDADMEETQ